MNEIRDEEKRIKMVHLTPDDKVKLYQLLRELGEWVPVGRATLLARMVPIMDGKVREGTRKFLRDTWKAAIQAHKGKMVATGGRVTK